MTPMRFTIPSGGFRWTWNDACQWAVLALLVFAVLWRGGKSLDATWILCGVATIVTLISHTLARRKEKSDVPLFLWLMMMAFIVMTAISYIYSSTRNYGLDEVFSTGSLGLLFFWAAREAFDEGTAKLFFARFVRTFSITTVGACVIGLLVYVFQPVNRFVGSFFDYRFHTDYWPNAWAQFLLLAWPVVLYWTLRDFRLNLRSTRGHVEFLVRTAVTGLVFSCLLLSYSRGGILVFAAQFALWGGIVYIKSGKSFPLRSIIPYIAAYVVIATLIFSATNALRSRLYEVQEIGEKVTLTAAEGSSSVSERVQFWSQALTLSAEKPVLGWGPYSFRFIQPKLQSSILATSDHPHNVFLKFLVERGLFAMVLFVLIIGTVLYRALRKLRQAAVADEKKAFSLHIMIFLGIFGVVAHNMIDYNVQFVGIALPFWLLLGILVAYSSGSYARTSHTTISRCTEILLATALLLLAIYEGFFLVITSVGRQAESRQDTEVALQWFDRAGGELFTRDVHLSRTALLMNSGKFTEAQDALDVYIAANPEDYRAWVRQADLASVRGERQLAIEWYRKALDRGRFNDLGILYGAYLLSEQESEITAQRPFIDGLLADYAKAIERNTHYIDLSLNVEQFVVICTIMARVYPAEAPRYQVMAAKADYHANLEREKLRSRTPGLLW